MSSALSDDRVFTIVDPLQYDGFDTSRGYLKPDKHGYIRTRDRDLAQEIQAREPHAIVTEHERETGGMGKRGGGKRGGAMLPAIDVPWTRKKYWFELRDERKHNAALSTP